MSEVTPRHQWISECELLTTYDTTTDPFYAMTARIGAVTAMTMTGVMVGVAAAAASAHLGYVVALAALAVLVLSALSGALLCIADENTP